MDKRASQPVAAPTTTDEVASIVDDIGQTRASMSSTVNEIEQRLSPAHLKEQIADIKDSALGQYHDAKDQLKVDLMKEFQEAKGRLEQEMVEARSKINHEIEQARQAVHDATVGRVEHMVHDAQDTVTEAKTTVFAAVRANPIPAALIAVGLGWLLMSARSSSSARAPRRVRPRPEPRPFDNTYGYGAAYAVGGRSEYARFPAGQGRDMRGAQSTNEGPLHSVQSGVAKLGHRISEGASDVGHKVQDVGHKVQEVGHKVQEGASDLVHQAQGAAHDVGAKVGNLAHQASDGVSHLAHQATDGVSHLAHQASEGVSHLAHQTSEGVSHLAHQASDEVSHLAHRAGEGVGNIAQGARSAASHLATSATSAGRSAYHGVETGMIRAEEGFESTLRANPLAIGAVALAVGVAVGLALPHTDREDEWLGETRDRLLDRAQHAAHDALEAAEQRVEALAGEIAPNQGQQQQQAGSSYGGRASSNS